MASGRKNNGGHSTKSTKATDKRKNAGRKLIEQYLGEDFDYDKLKKLMDKLLKDGMGGDTKSSTLFLSYVLGRPKENIAIEGSINIPISKWSEDE